MPFSALMRARNFLRGKRNEWAAECPRQNTLGRELLALNRVGTTVTVGTASPFWGHFYNWGVGTLTLVWATHGNSHNDVGTFARRDTDRSEIIRLLSRSDQGTIAPIGPNNGERPSWTRKPQCRKPWTTKLDPRVANSGLGRHSPRGADAFWHKRSISAVTAK